MLLKVLKKIVDGNLLRNPKTVKQFPFFIFLVVLAILLISNRYHSEKVIREINALQDTIKNLRSESISIAADLMNLSRPSEVVRKVKENELGLIESDTPPKVIFIEKEE